MTGLQSFDLNLLKAFDVLIETRSVTDAAKRLSITQPAASNALARLRSQLDDPLLVRTKQGMEPTPRALALRTPVREALRNLEQALLPTEAFEAQASQREFRIAAPDFIAAKLLGTLLARWQQLAPGVTIRVLHLGPDVPAQGLESGDVDLAIGRFLNLPSRLRRQTLSREKLVCLVADTHPVAASKMSLKEFLGLQFVWVSNTNRRGMVDRWLEQQGKARQVATTVNSYMTGAMLVADGHHGMVIASSYGCYFSNRLPIKAVPLKFNPGEFDIEMVWHAFTEGDGAMQWLRKEVAQALDMGR